MYCIKCGNKLDDDAIFCTECGHKQTKEMSETIEKLERVKSKKKGRLFVAGMIVITGIAIIMGAMAKHLKRNKTEKMFTSINENYYNFFSEETVDGERKEGFYDQQGNVFHTTEMVYDADGNPNYSLTQNRVQSGDRAQVAYSAYHGINLLNQSKKQIEIAKIKDERNLAMPGNKYFSCDSQKISFNGNAIVFQTGEDLFTWTGEIARDAIRHNQYAVENYVISANGNYILYTEKQDSASNGKELYYAVVGVEGSSKKISNNIEIPLAIADSGKDFYYIGTDYKLYYSDGEDKKCLSDFMIVNIANAMPCYFNETCDEIIFCDGGVTRYYCSGDEESKIIGRNLNACIPYVFQNMASQTMSTMKLEHFDYNIVILGKRTFANSILHDSTNIYWLDENANQLKQIDKGAYLSYLTISEDYSNLLYMKENKIYKVNMENIDFETCIYDANDVLAYSVSSDFKELYIHTNTGKILYMDLTKEEEIKELAEISDIYYGSYNEQQKAYIVCTENMELYKISPKKQTLLSTEACLVSIPKIGAVTYTVYGENTETAEVRMIMKNGESKILYSY